MEDQSVGRQSSFCPSHFKWHAQSQHQTQTGSILGWLINKRATFISHHLDNKVTALNNNFKEGRKLVFNDQSIMMVI